MPAFTRNFAVATIALLTLLAPAVSAAQQPPPGAPPLETIPETARRAPEGPQAQQAAPAESPEPFPGLFFRAFRDDPAVSRMPDTAGDPVKEEQRYRDCLARAADDPDHALDLAFRWSTDGGGLPAEHCIAVALITMGHPDVAAERFEDMLAKLRRGEGLPRDPLGGPASIDALAAGIYAQLGNARLLADDPERAIDAFSRALALLPADRLDLEQQLYIDRARAAGILGRFPDAIADLDRAEAIDPEVAEIYVLRASARRALGAYEQAEDDLARAAALRPEWPLLWLERANLKAMAGDTAAARALWLEIAGRWPASPEAEAARRNLARLDAGAAGNTAEDADGNTGANTGASTGGHAGGNAGANTGG